MASVPIKVPSVGESISEGILARWLKPDGGAVKAEEPLFELETDKASSVVPAPSSGVLKIGVTEGETVPIGATVGTIDPSGTPAASAVRTRRRRHRHQPPFQPPRPPPGGDGNVPLSPAVRRLVAEEGVDIAKVAATGPGGRVTKGDVLAYLETPKPPQRRLRRQLRLPLRQARRGRPGRRLPKSRPLAKPASA